MNTSEVLSRAADLIEQWGWTQGAGWNELDGSPLCLEGGIVAALGVEVVDYLAPNDWIINAEYDKFLTCPAYKAVKNYLGEQAPGALFCWNDLSSRTQAEVIETLRAAAVIEAARESEAAKVGASA